ncbi:diaminopropionate ammonia-lyase [Taklimakanibacter albus]|uniref:Diaminopropionate ammonia-lyase n=1 Tax=Taklimakanibacter albus TaxID=2800327 RepID=A0ACC5RD96_9HYPH|nr:diaminopropionate ammonia-lyase [Aestuariivirga sp. YIM B02566]MBK1870661.1 diaminopropionate ammonia-lyase [Aestuariivirga sp. YIM B02566]
MSNRVHLNTLPAFGSPLSEADRATVGRSAPDLVRPFLGLWGPIETTPLIALPGIAAEADVGQLFLKNEALRLGQGSFKALGGAYAVMVLFKRLLEAHLGGEVSVAQLLSPTAREFARTVTVCCATDGNHGKSVAAGARLLGCRSVIFVHQGVSDARTQALGADEIVRVLGSYDDSVTESERAAQEKGWHLVSDTSWPGYEETPAFVGQGYTILSDEALQQMQAPPTHVFLQAGVGGFAGSIAGYLADRLGAAKPVTIIVEPDRAACVIASARAGKLVSVTPGEPTVMAMLECFTPSLIAWRILEKTADAFMTVSEEDAKQAMRALAFPKAGDPPVVAGESGAAGLAGLLAIVGDKDARAAIKLDKDSRVLVINTETATDPASYEAIVGFSPERIIH